MYGLQPSLGKKQRGVWIQQLLAGTLEIKSKMEVYFFSDARRLSTPQEHKHSLKGAVGKVGVAEPANPSTEKQADGLSHLLHSVLSLGSCQWNWVVAGATAAFNTSQVLSTPYKSTKSRLPDTEITKRHRSLHLSAKWNHVRSLLQKDVRRYI